MISGEGHTEVDSNDIDNIMYIIIVQFCIRMISLWLLPLFQQCKTKNYLASIDGQS